eukprot:CAMPEP_0171896538 /NCGR_PEP_ID=MMETSP0992-20121227/47626_1 /TAXON_ID=483369 /ORGANISM="non described non described, Strain CCMP2098" /LENGTH=363 /DNA_ID=CAMNT_0012524547 /DNA_START=12 /DNA_END=1100 /DNA_ORIENTATION=+
MRSIMLYVSFAIIYLGGTSASTQQHQCTVKNGVKTCKLPSSLSVKGGGAGAPTVSVFGKFQSVVVNAKAHLVAAGCARAVSIFAMYPVDTIKTRLQMGLPALTSQTLKGVGALYKGAGSSLSGQIPYGMITFGSYEVYKEYLETNYPSMSLGLRTLIAAVAGDITGSVMLCPSEVVKQQVQGGIFGSTMAAIKGIVAADGPLGFYRGYGAQISRDVPFRACQLVTYELVKSAYLKLTKPPSSGASGALVGAIAGSFSAAVTTPLDVLKTRMMTGQAFGATSVLGATSLIVSKEGAAALFRGIVPRVALIGPSCAIFFMVYEIVIPVTTDQAAQWQIRFSTRIPPHLLPIKAPREVRRPTTVVA